MSQSTHSWTGEYRKLWLLGEAPDIEKFVADFGPVPPIQLAELLILDQSLRWDTIETTRAEQYFDRFPDLRNHSESAIDLVFSEFLLRERSGLNPVIDEYIDRFPQYADELLRQDAFHRALARNTPDDEPHDFESTLSSDTNQFHSRMGADEVPGYQILDELGRGGIGVVFKARHIQLNRPVALKMLLAGHFASEGLLRRFLVEAEATARLQHPNIVQIYEVGQHQGRPFLALEFVNGGTLSQRTAGKPQPPRDAALLVHALAGAVQFAHEKGVLHRDLKPGNILIQQLSGGHDLEERLSAGSDHPTNVDTSRSGGLPQNPSSMSDLIESNAVSPSSISIHQGVQVKIADFGLAKLVAGGSDADFLAATMSGDILGTAAYMSPEQARGDSTNLTSATDVYSLGAILYELLTGRPPFVGVQPLEVLGQVISDEPIRPSQLVRRVPKDIQTICLKCLEKAPGRRYGSAAALALDLERFLTDQPIVARHTSSIERSWRWCRRHPVRTSIVASITAILVLVATISSIYSAMLGNQLVLTSDAKEKEMASRVQALHQLWESQLAQADAIRTSNQIGQRFDALKAIDVARDLGNSISFSPEQVDRMRNATVACLAQPDLRVVRTLKGEVDDPDSIFTVDNNQKHFAFVQSGDQVVIRSTTDGNEVARVPISNPASIPLLSEDGMRLAILNDYCRVYALGSEEPKLIHETASQGVWGFTPNGSRILGTGSDGLLRLVDLADGTEVGTFGSITAIDEIAISPDSRRAAVFNGETVQVIDLETAQVCLRIENPQIRGTRHFAWHPNSKYLAIGQFATEGIELWDVIDGVRINTFYHDTGELRLGFNSTGERLLTYDAWGGSLLIWNISSGEIELSKVGIVMLAFSADETGGFQLLQKLVNGPLVVVEIVHPRIYYTLPLIHSPLSTPSTNDLAYSADGQLLAVVNRGEIQVFDARKYLELDRQACGYCYIHFAPDGSLLTSNEAGLARWASFPVAVSGTESPKGESTGQFLFGPPVYLSKYVAHAQFDVSSDGQTIAIPFFNYAWVDQPGLSDGPRALGPHNDIRRLSISPDSQRVVTGGWAGGKACVWDIASGKLLHTFDEPNCCLVQYSPDGKWIVTNSNKVRVWDSETWAPIADLSVDGISVSGVQVCFSPDSRILAVSDSTARINLFNPQTGKKIIVLTDPNEHQVAQMVFNPDGSQLAVFSGTRGGVVHVWDLNASRIELGKRDMDWSSDDSFPVSIDDDSTQNGNEARPDSIISSIQFVPDQRFVEMEAYRQSELLQQSTEKFDIVSARAAIANIVRLQPYRALTCNNLAWTLANGPQPLRDSATAVEFARRAIADESLSEEDRGYYLNTLGVALYRDSQIKEAVGFLEQSLAAQILPSKPFDLYVLSMCSARLGDAEKAREYFEIAESLVEQQKSNIPGSWQTELKQFSDEAWLLLGNDAVKRN